MMYGWDEYDLIQEGGICNLSYDDLQSAIHSIMCGDMDGQIQFCERLSEEIHKTLQNNEDFKKERNQRLKTAMEYARIGELTKELENERQHNITNS